MANSVKIEVLLDENGAVKGFKKIENAAEDVKKADKNLNWDGVKDGKAQLKETEGAADELQGSLGSVSDALGKLGAAAAAAGGIAVFGDYMAESAEASARLAATLAGTDADVAAFDEAMRSVYAAGYGESFDDIAEAANNVLQIVGTDTSPEALESITRSAIVLRDTFGTDVTESVKAAQVMMQNFGISSDEAFDLLAKGAQEGLNINGDMMDAFSEYSPYFAQLGLDATDMFNAMAAGADISMYGVDKAGDAFKEFGIRVVDGSEGTKAAFEAMGLSADEYAQKIMAGGDTAQQATSEIIAALLAIEDPVERNKQGVALFGTQWEDLGQDGAEAMLQLMGTAVDTAGTLEAINDVRYDSAGAALDVIGRTIMTSIFDPVVESIMPALGGVADWFTENSGTISAAVQVVMGVLLQVSPIIAGITAAVAAYTVATKAMTLAQTAHNAILKAGSVAQLALNAVMAANPIGLVIAAVAGLVAAFVLLWNNCEGFRNFWIGLWEAIKTTVSGAIASIGGFFEGLVSTARSIFERVKEAITSPIETAKSVISGIVETIKGFFSFNISWPHIPLPHINYELIEVPLLGSIPNPLTLSVDWYATGGMFNGPSVIGVGEAGTEFVVPRDGKHMLPFAQAVSENMAFPGAEEIAAAILAALIAAGVGQAVVNLDGRKVGELLAPYMDQINGTRYQNARRGLAQ